MSNDFSKIPHYLSSENFYAEVKLRMKQLIPTGSAMSLVTLDFDHFNYINDLFGYEIGDLILKKVTQHFSDQLKEHEIFSKIHADLFLFCLNTAEYASTAELFYRMADLKEVLKDILPLHYNIVASGGFVTVADAYTPLSAMLDMAHYARKKAKGNAVSSFLHYDKKMSEGVQWQKIVTISMEGALENGEFEMYLQPKILFETDKVVGAEALVRWNSPKFGLIVPDRFIPIMEQSGFIRQLDFYMLREACRFLKKCESMGKLLLPISVNFSKAHLSTDNLVEKIFQTVNQEGIPTHLIEIEFTESLSTDSFEKLIEVITDLKLLGFFVSLDDFGSAYSSLSCLKDLPIDIIKIDKGFLNSSTNTEKSKIIIAKMVELVKSLRMRSIMEGVETREQADFLQKLSCDFGQGYFYAKPMPSASYMDYISDGSAGKDISDYLEAHIIALDKSPLNGIPQEFQMDNWELYMLGKNIDIGLIKGYLDEDATVQYVNERALEYLGFSRQEFRERFHNSIIAFTHPDDIHIVQRNISQLISTGKPLLFQSRAIRKDGKHIILQGRASCVIDSQGRPVGLYAFQDVTEEMEKTAELQRSLEDKIKELEETVDAQRRTEESLRISEECYRVIVEQSNDIMFDWDFKSDTIEFSDKYAELFGYPPIVYGLTTSTASRQRIHPDDLEVFEKWILNTYRNPGCSVAQFRSRDSRGDYRWMNCHSTAICDDAGHAIRAVGLYSNIDKQKIELDTLTIKSQRDSLTKLLNKGETENQISEVLKQEPDKPGAFLIIDIDNFKEINDNLGHQLGDTVLINLSRKVSEVFEGDSIIGRIGGDEFAVYLWGLDENAVLIKAEHLTRVLRMAYYGSVSKYSISGSVGISFYPTHGHSFEALYHNADIALYESKNGGKDRYMVYQDHMTSSLRDNRTPMEWTESFLSSYFQGDFTFKIFEILYAAKDINTSIQLILELLGAHFNVDRVYIFQHTEDGLFTSNTFEWCGPGITAEKENLQLLPLYILKAYTDQYNGEGVFYCPDIRTLDDQIFEFCDRQGIKSLLHCAFYNAGVMTGFIGFDICRDYHKWTGEEIAILGYISRILSIFLIKSDTATELKTSYLNYVEMIENLNGYVYVVDPTNHKLLYINNTTKSLGVTISQTCHKMAFGLDVPCENCPLKELSDTVHFASKEIYAERLNGWVNASASKLKWEGTKDAVLICCTDISRYKTDKPEK